MTVRNSHEPDTQPGALQPSGPSQQKPPTEPRERLHRRILELEQSGDIDTLIQGIVHDFNNLLTVILGNAGLALGRLSKESTARVNISQIETAANLALGLVKEMRGSGKALDRSPVDFSRLVEEAVQLLETSILRNVTVERSFETSLPAIFADRAQLTQLVINLILNAFEALREEPRIIKLTTGLTNTASFKETFVTELSTGEYVSLEVHDTGVGMDAETQKRIFEPFFTTKPSGQGIGLSTVLKTVIAHDGVIRVESQFGKGSRFLVLLPVIAPAFATP